MKIIVPSAKKKIAANCNAPIMVASILTAWLMGKGFVLLIIRML